jgi:hypothetical protein
MNYIFRRIDTSECCSPNVPILGLQFGGAYSCIGIFLFLLLSRARWALTSTGFLIRFMHYILLFQSGEKPILDVKRKLRKLARHQKIKVDSVAAI